MNLNNFNSPFYSNCRSLPADVRHDEEVLRPLQAGDGGTLHRGQARVLGPSQEGEAWSGLGDMSKMEAMEEYVEEIKRVSLA